MAPKPTAMPPRTPSAAEASGGLLSPRPEPPPTNARAGQNLVLEEHAAVDVAVLKLREDERWGEENDVLSWLEEHGSAELAWEGDELRVSDQAVAKLSRRLFAALPPEI